MEGWKSLGSLSGASGNGSEIALAELRSKETGVIYVDYQRGGSAAGTAYSVTVQGKKANSTGWADLATLTYTGSSEVGTVCPSEDFPDAIRLMETMRYTMTITNGVTDHDTLTVWVRE